MYKYQKREPRYVYIVCLADDFELPVGVFVRLVEVANFLGCGWTTLHYMVNCGRVYKGMKVERIKLDD